MKKIILTDDVSEYIDQNKQYINDSLKDNDIEITEQNIFNEALSFIDNECDYFKEVVKEFDRNCNNKILVVGSLGLWYGTRTGQAVYNSLEECYSRFAEDSNTFYFERKNTTLTLKAIHHDGTNKFKFYELTKKGKRAITFERLFNL